VAEKKKTFGSAKEGSRAPPGLEAEQ